MTTTNAAADPVQNWFNALERLAIATLRLQEDPCDLFRVKEYRRARAAVDAAAQMIDEGGYAG